jgi:uncharacterized protein
VIVVLDSSVWISALEFGGVPRLAVERALTQDQVAISSFIRDEILRVLCFKFDRDPVEAQAHLRELLAQALWVETAGEVRGIARDPADDAILETARNAQAGVLVSGDKDLLSLAAFGPTSIISPARYLEFQQAPLR